MTHGCCSVDRQLVEQQIVQLPHDHQKHGEQQTFRHHSDNRCASHLPRIPARNLPHQHGSDNKTWQNQCLPKSDRSQPASHPIVGPVPQGGRIAIRQIRRHTKDDIESLEGEVSDDDIRRAEKQLQEVTDQHTKRIDELMEHKEQELLEV